MKKILLLSLLLSFATLMSCSDGNSTSSSNNDNQISSVEQTSESSVNETSSISEKVENETSSLDSSLSEELTTEEISDGTKEDDESFGGFC